MSYPAKFTTLTMADAADGQADRPPARTDGCAGRNTRVGIAFAKPSKLAPVSPNG